MAAFTPSAFALRRSWNSSSWYGSAPVCEHLGTAGHWGPVVEVSTRTNYGAGSKHLTKFPAAGSMEGHP